MDERIVFQPQRHVAHVVRLRRLQLGKHRRNQFGVFIGQFRLGLVSDQGPFHRYLPGASSHLDPKDVWRPAKDAGPRKIFSAASFARSGSSLGWKRRSRSGAGERRTAMQEPYSQGEKYWVLGVTALASFMMALDAMIITTAFAAIRADFSSPVETLQWTVNAFNLTFAVLLLTGAALGDRFGRRRMFAAGIALFTLASIACALADTAVALIAARATQGAGAALVMPLAMAILSGAFGREERARALGIFSGITGLALIIGPAIGGVITPRFGLGRAFWMALDLLDQPADRPDRGRAGGDAAARKLWSRGATGHSGTAAGRGRGSGAGMGAAARQCCGLGQSRGHYGARHRPAVCDRLRRPGAMGISADGADAVVWISRVRGGRYRQLPVLCRDVWRAVPVAAIFASHAWLRPIRCRAAAAALDRDAVRDRADRGGRRQPVRRTEAGSGRIVDAGDRPWLDRRHRLARSQLSGACCAAGAGRHRRFDGDAGGTERDPRFSNRDRNGQGLRYLQHGAFFRRHVRHRSAGRDLLLKRRDRYTSAFLDRLRRGDDGCGHALAARRFGRSLPAGAAARACVAEAAERLTSPAIRFRYRPIGKRALDPACK